ncbi:MAG: transcription elongation factor GreA [Chloroflexi bacterium]|nr:MAG: transcription elongation factor GreA [Chloroflexota bacterium]TMG16131.1 MAG: transcription elongation factor GreA [Chloroflexota bacterium]
MSCVLGQTSGEASAAAVSMITRPATRNSRLTRGAASGTLNSRLSSARESTKHAALNVSASIAVLFANRSASSALRSEGSMRRAIIHFGAAVDLTEPVLLTPEGLEKLKRDLEVALRRRAEAGERLKEAFQPGDIEDNPEYEQAKEEVGLLDSRIYELQEMIGRAQIIRDTHSSVVGPGSTIEVVDNQGDSETYHLVGAVESDPSAGRISVDSPVGRALVGHKKGDRVTVSVPSGTLTLTIKAVK